MVEVPVKIYVTNLVKKARPVARPLARLSDKVKRAALHGMADRLLEGATAIFEANRQDFEAAGKNLEREAAREAVERVRLPSEAVNEMAERLRQIADLPDPVGETTRMWQQPDGLQVSRVRIPIGVLAVISEGEPKVTVESVAICLKSGNVCVFRGAPEWARTHTVIFQALREAADEAGVPEGAVTFVERPEREAALELMRLHSLLDGIIPRGGLGLRKTVMEQSRVPILCHDGGISHIYIDADADLAMAQNIVVNSKVQLASAPTSADTVLIHQSVARSLLAALVRRLLDEFKVELRGCPKTLAITSAQHQEMTGHRGVIEAKEEDWGRQFLSPTLAVKLVKDLDEALDHIARYGPSNTDTIVTRDYATAMRFVRDVDASAVMVNASSRLHDGDQLGLGVQMGISTGRLHAKGPIGLEELTCQKYVVLGTGQLRQPHPVPLPYEDAIMLKRPLG
ncbi:MAG: glutamate-5-semialdehyde dehydrogenase [Nitrospiraceae bacterium]